MCCSAGALPARFLLGMAYYVLKPRLRKRMSRVSGQDSLGEARSSYHWPEHAGTLIDGLEVHYKSWSGSMLWLCRYGTKACRRVDRETGASWGGAGLLGMDMDRT